MVMSGNTASFRFPGSINCDLNKLSYSLKCRPFLHYYIPSFAPLCALRNQPYKNVVVSELIQQMTLPENMMVDSRPEQSQIDANPNANINGKCVAYAALFRGTMTSQEVDEGLCFLRGDQTKEVQLRSTIGHAERFNPILERVKNSQEYNNKNPRPTFNTITDYAPPGMPLSCVYIRNTSAIKFKFLTILREAMKMYSTGAFVHWYEKEKFANPTIPFESLGDTLQFMSEEWITQFGAEDTTGFPEAQTESALCQEMISGDL